ncbi:olfactory receptor 1J21-like [Aquarana catesbeiana]|uniref:olfactory receptor 1J21-like n=1 Tax=Aquarana catesbeiana TaxID=8400 RepID=UPI003CCA42FA
MEECPNSTEIVFHILAFSTNKTGQCLTMVGVLLMYLMAVLGNMTIVLLGRLVPQLHTPMYFFLSNLAISDVIYVSVTLPKLLSILLTHDHRMSFSACVAQVYFFSLSAGCDMFLLTSMSYDRYMAICKPLQYSLLMNKNVYILMALGSWLIAAINATIDASVTSLLSFCFTQNINHFFCERKTLYVITSSDVTSGNMLMVFQDIFLACTPFLLIIVSYVFIISTILNIKSLKGQRKAFSSCTSHLIAVMLFYGPIIIFFAKSESEHSKELDKLLCLLYAAVVPMLNPFVYTLRNKDILSAIRNVTKEQCLIIIQLFVNHFPTRP